MTNEVWALRPFLLRFAEPLKPSNDLEVGGLRSDPGPAALGPRSAAERPNMGTRITRTNQESTDDE